MVLILVGHVLRFLLHLSQLCILFLNVTFRLRHILLEPLIELDKHVLPVEKVFL